MLFSYAYITKHTLILRQLVSIMSHLVQINYICYIFLFLHGIKREKLFDQLKRMHMILYTSIYHVHVTGSVFLKVLLFGQFPHNKLWFGFFNNLELKM